MASPLALAMMQGQQAGTPTAPFRATVAPTDVEKAYSDYNNQMMQAYSAKLAQQNAMWGGLAGLGSAGIMTLPKIMGGAGGAAGAGASTAGAAGADAAASMLGATGIGDSLAALGPLAFLAI